ncbi:MAG: carbohydrate ABC transporter permease, partial [Chloroflexi bacterium]
MMKTTPFSRAWYSVERFVPVIILTIYSIIALFPVVMILVNSFKSRKAIFGAPFQLPTSETFSLIGYETVIERSTFHLYFLNSAVVTFVALILTLFIGAMAAFALAEYDFPGNALMALYLSIGIMIPIRLGT